MTEAAEQSSIDIAVKDWHGKVVMEFKEPQKIVIFDPQNAHELGEGLARAAYEARFGKKPADGKSVLSEQRRHRMVIRAGHIIRSLEGKIPDLVASHVVDAMLGEIY